MSRLHTPATIESAPAASQMMLESVKKQLDVVPNLFRLVGSSGLTDHSLAHAYPVQCTKTGALIRKPTAHDHPLRFEMIK